MPNDQVITVRGEEDLATRAGHLFTGVNKEFLCAATDMDTWSRPSTRAAIVTRMRPAVQDRDLTVRKLYTSAALADAEQREQLLQVAAVGAQVRICESGLPHETIIIDRRVMILAGPRTHGDREFTVTTSPGLIDPVHGLFDATWEAAVPLADRLELPMIGPDGQAILRTLGAGLTDEVAARRMGISLRTYRRRVAELLRALDSDSRFQAGLRAGELGLSP
ncbi:DNA-binding response regulator [Actinoallomurus sp. NBC_01490]|uniref:DNA-binding response regulator n=1 Tax=Actinoallomurus sp. NBC_01490 TaxID=2903557 RepID=UPI002E36F8DE|nr:DNA-binding response regulator [Actinoallomurus sp. NBC_01490]